MDLAILFVKLGIAAIWGVVVGLLARRKNRNPWTWGLAGVLSWFIALIVLAFKSYQCPKCEFELTNEQGRAKTCPFCGPIGTGQVGAEPAA